MSEEFEQQLAELDAETEIIQIVRRDSCDMEVDFRGLDVDTAISLLLRAAIHVILDEVFDGGEDEEEELEDEDDS